MVRPSIPNQPYSRTPWISIALPSHPRCRPRPAGSERVADRAQRQRTKPLEASGDRKGIQDVSRQNARRGCILDVYNRRGAGDRDRLFDNPSGSSTFTVAVDPVVSSSPSRRT